MKTMADDLDVLNVKAEEVNFHQKRLHSASLVLMMPMTVYDLDAKAEVVIFHQKKLHSELKYFDDEIHLKVHLPNLGVDYGFGTHCCSRDDLGHLQENTLDEPGLHQRGKIVLQK
jgi:hypothetical protein